MWNVQINLNGFWEEFYIPADTREEALTNGLVQDRLIDSDYAPLVRPAIYKEWDYQTNQYTNGGGFLCPCSIHGKA